MKEEEIKQKSIEIYTSKQGVDFKVHMENESVWLTQNQISELYGKDRTVITKHIGNLFKDKEVDEKSNVQKMHIAKISDWQRFLLSIFLIKINLFTRNPVRKK